MFLQSNTTQYITHTYPTATTTTAIAIVTIENLLGYYYPLQPHTLSPP